MIRHRGLVTQSRLRPQLLFPRQTQFRRSTTWRDWVPLKRRNYIKHHWLWGVACVLGGLITVFWWGKTTRGLLPMNLKVFDEFRKEDRNNLPIIDRNTHIAHPCFNRKWVHVIFVIGASSQISSAITRELTMEGGPGTGAYDQAELLSKDWDIVHISPTQVLKAEQAREGSKYADTITKFMAAGELVPLEITVGLIQRNMQYHIGRGKFCFVIDGFPRRMDQAMAFENNIVEPAIVLALDAPGDILFKRLKEKEGKKNSDEGILKRLEASRRDVDPVVEYYAKRHKLQMIPCDDTPQAVYAQIMVGIQNIVEGWYYYYAGGLT